MKRQRVREHRNSFENGIDDDDHRNLPMRTHRIRRENVLEAQIQEGDTLQAIALRYNCTIADIKRLNKIEKEIEIHARKTIKVPMNAHTVLLSTGGFELPAVHKSGQNSPKHVQNSLSSVNNIDQQPSTSTDRQRLDEKLLIASVNASTANSTSPRSINETILSSIMQSQQFKDNPHENDDADLLEDERQPLFIDDTVEQGRIGTSPHAIRGAPRSDFSCNGSDCDISWICLLVFILALCFAIPLVYVIYIAEHPEQFHHNETIPFVRR